MRKNDSDILSQGADVLDNQMNFIAAYQLALAGQEEGYRFLYDSTCQPVYEYILQNVEGKDAADRLIGKVYETAWAGLGGLSDPNAFPGWVQGIAESAVMWEKKNPAVGEKESGGVFGRGIPHVRLRHRKRNRRDEYHAGRISEHVADRITEPSSCGISQCSQCRIA